MKRRQKYFEAEVSNAWMISYMDLLTILLIFFVAVSAQGLSRLPRNGGPALPSTTEKAGLPALSRSEAARSENPVPALSPTTGAEPREALLRALRRLQQRGLDPRLEPRGLVISLPAAVLFSSGRDEINPAALPIVGQIADVLREIPSKVSLVGHADPVPIHNRFFKNNWELSLARSLKLLELLNQRFGIPESRLSIAGYSSYSPRNPNDTADGRASNRRVEIILLDELGR